MLNHNPFPTGFTEVENDRLLAMRNERLEPAEIARRMKRCEMEISIQIELLQKKGIAACSTRRGPRTQRR